MHVLVAGAAARLGAALGSAVAERGHEVAVADRAVELDTRHAAGWFLRSNSRGEFLDLRSDALLTQLKPALARADAIVIAANPRDVDFDLDLTIAIAEGIVSLSRGTPIIRLTTAGGAGETVSLSRGRARLRDFPLGLPVERTLASLGEADRALRLISTMRDHRCVLVRPAECIAPGRFAFETTDAASLALLSRVLAAPTIDAAPRTSVDLVDARLLAAAVEKCAGQAEALDGQVLHLTGGPACRLDLRQVLEIQAPLLGGAAAAWSDGGFEPRPSSPAAAHLLDDGSSRRSLRFSDLTWAPRAIAAFQGFAAAHAPEFSIPSLRYA
jgi:nucleoside-diphosphate-sugar epimerase